MPKKLRPPIYTAWINMKDRCYNKNYSYYSYYGGRGIRVCDEWVNSFQTFFRDMSPTWQKGLSLDRIENEGNYGPTNCRWATKKEQGNNRRKPKRPQKLKYTLPITGIKAKDLAEKLSISIMQAYRLLKKSKEMMKND